MALFKRKDLEAQGLNENQISWLMTEAQRALADSYTLKTAVQEQIDAAVQAALEKAPQAVDPTMTDAYKAVAEERDMLRALNGSDFVSVKPKFREAVYKQLDKSQDAKPIAEQLNEIRGTFEEYFEQTIQPDQEKTPRFGAEVSGSMPEGGGKKTFESLWFGNKK